MRRRLVAFMCGLVLAALEPDFALAQTAAIPDDSTVRLKPETTYSSTVRLKPDTTYSSMIAAAHRTRGLERGYNLDHADALSAFKDAIAADPTDPAAYRLAAATVWTRVLFEQGAITIDDYLGQASARLRRRLPKPELAAEFHHYIRQALALSEQQLRSHPADANAHYQVGAAFGCLASYTATVEGRVLDSLGPARRAYKAHQRVLALDPRRKDAALIVGITRHAVAGLSAPLRFVAHLAGFDGGHDRGLRLVEDAAHYPGETQRNALFTLVLLYNREARYQAAVELIGELQQRYPRNRLLWLEAGNTLLRARRPTEAKAALEEGLARLSLDTRPRAPGEDSRWRFAYGSVLVALKDIPSAGRELNAALTSAAHDWIRGRIRKELGKLAELSLDRSRALDEYRKAEQLCRHDEDDDCVAEVKRLMKHGYR